jgi:hypothetical protein
VARSYEQIKIKVNYRKFSFHDDVITVGINIVACSSSSDVLILV